MLIWRSMLQRPVLRKRRILCQWAVPSLEVEPVEPAELEQVPEPRRPTSAPQVRVHPLSNPAKSAVDSIHSAPIFESDRDEV